MTSDVRSAGTRLTAVLLASGVVAGLVITTVSLTLACARPGFDPTRHANSLLVLGDWGWVQSVNFVVCGLLLVAFGAGIWRSTAGVRSGRIAAVCVVVYGLLAGVVVGLNPADPGFGFPPGAPEGYPAVSEMSMSAKIHGVAGLLGFLAVTCGCFALARYFVVVGDRVWTVVSGGIGLAVLSVSGYLALNSGEQTGTFNYVPTWLVGSALWLFVAAVAFRLLRSHRDAHVGAQ
ncbi:DUF998 domain-containing protein [Mycolicibacterium sp. HK-90]|uniref:DUF998 domain-containing protein n=1 Tax=Mycolicibacterium sp. HK-90 TaxID=3056937 RepID=UPI002659CFB4|nr:DUF998 domain-containing protein [Mycolicibacterium sp. HK-90]WKG00980.1 DUF998 domain-containing protein [Mycolicibacterium sp. HK-90]